MDNHPTVAKGAGVEVFCGNPWIYRPVCLWDRSINWIPCSVNGVTSRPYVIYGINTLKYSFDMTNGETGTHSFHILLAEYTIFLWTATRSWDALNKSALLLARATPTCLHVITLISSFPNSVFIFGLVSAPQIMATVLSVLKSYIHFVFWLTASSSSLFMAYLYRATIVVSSAKLGQVPSMASSLSPNILSLGCCNRPFHQLSINLF